MRDTASSSTKKNGPPKLSSFAPAKSLSSTFLEVCVAMALTGGGACSSDIFDVDVTLQRQTTTIDFGANQGTIPVVTCGDPTQPDVCRAGAAAVPQPDPSTGVTDVQLACDASTQRCFAQAQATIIYPVNILQDDDFVTKIERRSVVIVKVLDIAYTVPSNSLTFDVPAIQISVGPAGSTAATDPGVVPVGTTNPLPAGATFDDSAAQHLVVADDSAARAFIEQNIMNKQTLVFIATFSPRLEAGAPIPAGSLELDLVPHLTLGVD
jgi:hypothetical protein